MCAGYGMRIRQLGVSAAFLQADLEEEIYVRAPRGFEGHVKEGEVLRYDEGCTVLNKEAPPGIVPYLNI